MVKMLGGLPSKKINGKNYMSKHGSFSTKKKARDQAKYVKQQKDVRGKKMWSARVVGDRKNGYRVYQRRK